MHRTYVAKPDEINRTWWVVDAEGIPAGRLAVDIARLLQGKHKTTFTPHMDTGDCVIVINVDKLALTGNNKRGEELFRHSQYPGGLKSITRGDLMAKRPDKMLQRVVSGMLPKTRLRPRMMKRFKIYSGGAHPHSAQNPQPISFNK